MADPSEEKMLLGYSVKESGIVLPKRSRARLLAGSATIVAVATIIQFFFTFSYTSICTACGSIQHTTEFHIPFAGVTYWHSRSETETPLSKIIAKHQLAPAHSHSWLFANGAGGGVTCAIGEGRHLYGAVQSSEVASFVDAVATYEGHVNANQWLNRLLDPKRSQNALNAIHFAGVPDVSFTNQPQFEQWKKDHDADLYHTF